MQRTNRIPQPIEFKGTTLPVVIVTLRSLQADELARAATTLFGDNDFFDGDAAVLDLAQLVDVPEPDWRRLKQLFKSHGLNVIGVRGGSEELRYGAAFAGLPTYSVNDRPTAAGTAARAAAATPPAAAEVAETPPVDPTPPPAPTVARTPTLFVSRPLRSGQQVYARGGDLVVLAAVNAGAEVIADGSIHIYAPLRGRALAGASGATEARILCTRFDAELVSVAGLYRTFDGGVAHELAGRPVQVRLLPSADLAANQLIVEALSTD